MDYKNKNKESNWAVMISLITEGNRDFSTENLTTKLCWKLGAIKN